MHSFWSRLLVVIVGLSLLGLLNLNPAAGSPAGGAASLQSGGITMVAPSACPQGGCAAGQTLTMLVSFPFSGYDQTLSPNLKVCVFAPNAWDVNPAYVMMDTQGLIPNLTYTNDPINCQEIGGSLADYRVIATRQAAVNTAQSADALRVSFRISWTGSGSYPLKARILTRNSSNQWTVVSDLTSPVINPLDPAEVTYVANDPAACGSSRPCFVNSGADGPGGFGTALKDAVDAIPAGLTNAVINVLGTYTIKTNSVSLDQPATITSLDSAPATITYTGIESEANCSAPMLTLRESITLSNLYIKDGTCVTRNRTLVEIDPDPNREFPINITSNTLSGGLNAILIHDIKAQVNVLYNDIFGNSGYSLYWNGATKQGPLWLIANNVVAGSTFQIDCAGGTNDIQSIRWINHNYWGGYIPDNATHCNSTPSKRLGAPVLPRPNKPGVSAARVTVTDKMPTRQPTPTLGPEDEATATLVPIYGQLAFNRSGDGSQNFDMYIVDHGSSVESSQPFARSSIRGQSACGSYYDFFLPEGVNPPNTTLDLYFYYDISSPECETMVRYSAICQNRTPTPATVPLMWFNATAMPTAWSSVMQGVGSEPGQAVTCDNGQKLLHVAIDSSGRPGLSNDMGYTPLLLGAPILQSFQAYGEDEQIRVEWKTNVETDIEGFYLMRGDSPTTMDLLEEDIFYSYGTATSGYTYSYVDYNLVNGQKYYYRLKIKRMDGKYFYSEIRSIAPNLPTATAPATRTPVTPSATPSFTMVLTKQPTRAFTSTITYGPGTPSPTLFMLPTLTGPAYTQTPIFGLSGTPGVLPSAAPQTTQDGLPTLSPTVTITLPPKESTGTAIAMVQSLTPTPTRRPTRTSTPEIGVVAGESASGPTWLSLLLGLLAGAVAAAAAGGAWWYYRSRP